MKVFITGTTGYIGHAVAAAVAKAGHEVVGLARSNEAAERLAKLGYSVERGDLHDPKGLAAIASRSDAVIHAATTGGADNAEADANATRAILGALEGSGKPFIYTSGVWGAGNTGERIVDETDVTTPLPLVAWRAPVEDAVLAAAGRGVRGVVVRPGIVYGEAGGIPAMFVGEARQKGHVRVVEGGHQEWSAIYLHDLADLYVRALRAAPGSVFHGTNGGFVRVKDIAVAASIAGGAKGKTVDWPLADARKEFGGFADALALQQRVASARTQRILGWRPRGPSLIEELLIGSYAKQA